jgi:hypothetical protein
LLSTATTIAIMDGPAQFTLALPFREGLGVSCEEGHAPLPPL